MPANSKGQMVPNKTAGAKANSKTAGPNHSFPIGDAKHARLAISGATRSENAGNISASTAASIKTKAEKALGGAKAKTSASNLGAFQHRAGASMNKTCPTCHRPM